MSVEPPGTDPHPRARPRKVPQATYRVQLHAGFTFADAAAIADYLAALGISHLYLSPVLQAGKGSTHGYDVVDPTRVNEELGGAAGHLELQEALSEAGLGQLLDIVPNHMAITGRENAWWWDVLENGPASIYASYFDVDWDPPESKLRDVVLLPILADHYGRELEAGRLPVMRDGGSLVLTYFDHSAPIAPRSADRFLAAAATRLPRTAAPSEAAPTRAAPTGAAPTGAAPTGAAPTGAGAGASAGASASAGADSTDAGINLPEELESIATAFGRLPRSTATDAGSVRERHRDKEILRARLARMAAEHPSVAVALDAELDALNADPDALDDLLERQNYRLAWWRTAAEELDYRRFFDINDLAGIRVEDPEVFADSHQLILRWLHAGVIDGVRIDHIDGLRDPRSYLARLAATAPEAWIVVEKILETGERLPADWPVAGTTGYDWLNVVGGLAVDGARYRDLLDAYQDFSGSDQRYEDIVYAAKQAVLDGPLAADVSRLTARLTVVCERHRRYRDYTRRDLHDCLAEVLAAFGVYRSYVAVGREPTDTDVATVDAAVLVAGLRRPDIDDELLGFIEDLLLLRVPGDLESELALQFQQLSGPVMAKAVEDTAFYRYVPLASLNEVGGDPGHPGVDVGDFHEDCRRRQSEHPGALLATSTHDTKRSEDVRARIAVLAEIPTEWNRAVQRWRQRNDRHRVAGLPDRNVEWLLYQTLVGAWPLDRPRVLAYMEKATREAKMYTSWTDPNTAYDETLRHFITEVLADDGFVAEVEDFVGRIRRPGWVNSLAQKLLTLCAPGVPDLYQGSELWDLSLVDPDNRRPVDYPQRRRLLARADVESPAEAWAGEDHEGLSKLHVVRAALGLRTRHPHCFGPGPSGHYQPLEVCGAASAHAVAFSRGDAAVAIAVRLPVGLERAGGWGATTVTLPDGDWSDLLGPGGGHGVTRHGPIRHGPIRHGPIRRGVVSLADLLSGFPVALLERREPERREPERR